MQLEFKTGDKNDYKVEGIKDSVVYARKAAGQLWGLYDQVLWKGYPEDENT